MAWIWACLFVVFSHLHQQAHGVAVTCLWERYFLTGGNVSGACQVGLAPPGCGGQSLRLTAAGEAVFAHHYDNDSAHFTVRAPAENTLHLHCELSCSGLKPLPFCDITVQAGYPPTPPSHLECHIPYSSSDILCSWDPGKTAPLPVSYTLHWEQHSGYSEREVEAGMTSAVIPGLEYSHAIMSVWVVASSPLGVAQSEHLSFYTLDVVQPPAPVITSHSTQPLEILWDLECDPTLHMTEELDRSCEVEYRIRGEPAWTEGDHDAQGSFMLVDPQPFSEYSFRVRCACFGKEAIKSTWSHIYSVQSSEAAPAGKLDVWSDCEEDSDGQSECAIVWKEPPVTVARGKVLTYLVMVERNPGNQTVTNLSAEALWTTGGSERTGGCWGAPCFRFALPLQGVTGAEVTAYTSQGATSPAPLALLAPGPHMLASHDFSVAKEGRGFNVSWTPPSHLTGNVQYVVQSKEAGVRPTRAFNWIKLNGSQRSFILAGDYRDYTPYNISLFSVAAERRCLLGSAIAYTVQGVPEKVTSFQVSQIHCSDVTLTWELPLTQRRGVILYYHLGQGNHTEYSVSGDSTRLLISGLWPGQEYHFWICAETEAGLGPKEYRHFMSPAACGYIIFPVLLFAVLLAFGLIFLLLSKRQRGVHGFKQLGCCAEVPDPNNSRLFRQSQCNWNGWIGLFSTTESVQKLSELEVIEREELEDTGCQEMMVLPDAHTHGQVRDWRTGGEEEDAEDEAEEEWRDALEMGRLEPNGNEEAYSKMIDSEAEEQNPGESSRSWSPAEPEDFFSGYEKHFMPDPSEV